MIQRSHLEKINCKENFNSNASSNTKYEMNKRQALNFEVKTLYKYPAQESQLTRYCRDGLPQTQNQHQNVHLKGNSSRSGAEARSPLWKPCQSKM